MKKLDSRVIRHLLFILLAQTQFSFECLCLNSQDLKSVPYAHENANAEIHFLIINTQDDGSVIPAIKRRERGLF